MQVCQNEVREEKKDCLAKLRFVQLQLFPFLRTNSRLNNETLIKESKIRIGAF